MWVKPCKPTKAAHKDSLSFLNKACIGFMLFALL